MARFDDQAIVHAAYRGDLAAVQKELARGVNVDSPAAGGKTSLHTAAGNGHHAVVRHLLDAGCRTDLRDSKGRTAADFAGAYKQNAAKKMILEAAAAAPAAPAPAAAATEQKQKQQTPPLPPPAAAPKAAAAAAAATPPPPPPPQPASAQRAAPTPPPPAKRARPAAAPAAPPAALPADLAAALEPVARSDGCAVPAGRRMRLLTDELVRRISGVVQVGGAEAGLRAVLDAAAPMRVCLGSDVGRADGGGSAAAHEACRTAEAALGAVEQAAHRCLLSRRAAAAGGGGGGGGGSACTAVFLKAVGAEVYALRAAAAAVVAALATPPAPPQQGDVFAVAGEAAAAAAEGVGRTAFRIPVALPAEAAAAVPPSAAPTEVCLQGTRAPASKGAFEVSLLGPREAGVKRRVPVAAATRHASLRLYGEAMVDRVRKAAKQKQVAGDLSRYVGLLQAGAACAHCGRVGVEDPESGVTVPPTVLVKKSLVHATCHHASQLKLG